MQLVSHEFLILLKQLIKFFLHPDHIFLVVLSKYSCRDLSLNLLFHS
jgi:hypothetical protein